MLTNQDGTEIPSSRNWKVGDRVSVNGKNVTVSGHPGPYSINYADGKKQGFASTSLVREPMSEKERKEFQKPPSDQLTLL